jgi:hypothetical protein
MTVSLVSGVEKYAAPRQNAVGVRDERRGTLHVYGRGGMARRCL